MSDTEEVPPLDADANLYEVLEIDEKASMGEIRTAYRKLALSVHPDKVKPEERDSAHKKFQEVAFAYAVLNDETRRKRYDETGNTNEGVLDDDSFDWKTFFKEQYADVVSAETVNKFKAEYQGSAEERKEVLDAYTESKGSLDEVFENVMVSSVLEDEARFRRIIDEGIESGKVKGFKRYTNESEKAKKARRDRATAEEAEAEEYAKELGVHDALFGAGKSCAKKAIGGRSKRAAKGEEDNSALQKLIQSRNSNRLDDLVKNLEAKYGGSSSRGRKRKGKDSAAAEPTEEEFLAAQAKLSGDSDAKPNTRAKRRKTKH